MEVVTLKGFTLPTSRGEVRHTQWYWVLHHILRCLLCGYLPTCPRGSFMTVVKPAMSGCVSMTWYSMFIVLVSGCVPTVVSSGIVPLCMCLSDRNPAKGVVEEHNLLLTLS
ncbi:hypothetical protein Tco_1495557, partial [Tanacetum coccineum]